MRAFFIIKDAHEEWVKRRRSRRPGYGPPIPQVIHTTTSFASAGKYACPCGLAILDHLTKKISGVLQADSRYYEWCPACHEDYMAERAAEILSGKGDPFFRIPD